MSTTTKPRTSCFVTVFVVGVLIPLQYACSTTGSAASDDTVDSARRGAASDVSRRVVSPIVHDLSLELTIEECTSPDPCNPRATISIVNRAGREQTLIAEWADDETGDYVDYFRRHIRFTTYPETPMPSFQSGRPGPRTLAQPSYSIAVGGSLDVSWEIADTRLSPAGELYARYRSPILGVDGLYMVRAECDLRLKDGTQVRLWSNEQQLTVGKSNAAPRKTVAHARLMYPETGELFLNVGELDGARIGDIFMIPGMIGSGLKLTVNEVRSTSSKARIEPYGSSTLPTHALEADAVLDDVVPYRRHEQ
jgi:hypothetical protein